MAIQIFSQCCFCCTLRTGGIILGWFYTIVGFLGFLAFGAAFLFDISVSDINADGEVVELTFIAIIAITSLLYSIAGLLLIFGIRQDNYRKMLMIFVVMVIGIVLTIVELILSPKEAIFIILLTIFMLLQIYFILVIYSIYVRTKNEKTQLRGPYPYAQR